ncbi:AAA family ATPase [Propionibacteriaceae bacterium Y1923]
MTAKAFANILEAAERGPWKVTDLRQGRFRMQCPAHEGNGPNVSVTDYGDGVGLKCHSRDCGQSEILEALGLTARDAFDAPETNYLYDDGRIVTRDNLHKRFRQSGNTSGTPTLYRAAKVRQAVADGRPVLLVEGEKDVHSAEAAGHVATTAPMGAGNFGKVDAAALTGADVVAVVDRDEAGVKWAGQVRAKLEGVAQSVRFVQAVDGKDLSDHLTAGHGVDALEPFELEAADEGELPARRAHVTWADLIEPEPVVWAWEDSAGGRIPSGSLSVAAGREGTGKSSFGIWLAAQITRGTLPGSFHGTPRTVFYVAVEDSWKYTLVPRLMAAGADLSKVGRFDVVSSEGEELSLSLPHDNSLLEQAVLDHGVALVVIDPLMSVIGEKIDTHREREVRSALDPLAKLADRTGSVLLGIAHFNKGAGTDAASLITGSGAFKNVPRSVFGFARDEADEAGGRVMSQVKNSLGRDDMPSLGYVIESAEVETRKGIATTGRFTFTGETERSVADILRDSHRDPEDLAEAKDAASWIADYLSSCGGESPAMDVINAGKALGYPEKTLKNARRKVADTQRTGGSEGGVWTWILRVGPANGPEGPTHQRPGPSGPMPGPMAVPGHCTVCHDPMVPLGDGSSTHPACDGDAA